jgi:integral membrane sensor domain MASE1
MKIICKGKKFPLVEDDIKAVIFLLSSIPKTCIYFSLSFPMFSFLLVGAIKLNKKESFLIAHDLCCSLGIGDAP